MFTLDIDSDEELDEDTSNCEIDEIIYEKV